MELIDHDLELFASLLDVFSTDWPEVVEELRGALKSKDADTVERFGHRLKGNLRNFYADDLASLALKIEEMGRNQDLSNLENTLNELEPMIQLLESQLKDTLSQLKQEQG